MTKLPRPTLQPHAGIDWSRVRFDPPDAIAANVCSYCSGPVGLCALRLWTAGGAAAVFCDPCATDMFGIQIIDET